MKRKSENQKLFQYGLPVFVYVHQEMCIWIITTMMISISIHVTHFNLSIYQIGNIASSNIPNRLELHLYKLIDLIWNIQYWNQMTTLIIIIIIIMCTCNFAQSLIEPCYRKSRELQNVIWNCNWSIAKWQHTRTRTGVSKIVKNSNGSTFSIFTDIKIHFSFITL